MYALEYLDIFLRAREMDKTCILLGQTISKCIIQPGLSDNP